MTSYEKKGNVKKLLFDSIPIENYIFSLLHTEIGVGNNIYIYILNGLMFFKENGTAKPLYPLGNFIGHIFVCV